MKRRKRFFSTLRRETPQEAAKAAYLYWIIEQNEALPEGEKIRVVSVSAAPMSWPDGGGFANGDRWAEAVAAAEEAGMLVIDAHSSEETGFVGRSYREEGPSDDVKQYKTYDPPSNNGDVIFAPSSFRTTAQEYREGNYIYTHWGNGGLSWSVPLCGRRTGLWLAGEPGPGRSDDEGTAA